MSARLRGRGRGAALAAVLAVGALAGPAPAADAPAMACESSVAVDGWVTAARPERRLAPFRCVRAGPARMAGRDVTVVRVDAHAGRQRVEGFGAALTDAAAMAIRRTHHPDALLQELFGPAPGIGLGFLRVPIGATDFSVRHYSLDDVAAGEQDPGLEHFELDPARAGVPALAAGARRINPQLRIIASPWSAPAWMKDSQRLVGGRLLPAFYDAYARYLLRFATAYAEAGVPLFAITVQNEPRFEPRNYPGMRFVAAERSAFLREHLAPLRAEGHVPLAVLDWDHNWDHPEEPAALLADPLTAPLLAGVAWHCYAGDRDVQRQLQRDYPAVPFYLTECSGGGWQHGWTGAQDALVGDLVIPQLRMGARAVLLWNLALDEHHGPHLGGCGNCRGVVTVDSRSGEVTRNPEYYALAHFSRFAGPDALRVESTDVAPGAGELQHVAFVARSGDRVLVVHNRRRAGRRITVEDAQARPLFSADVPGAATVTFVWREPADPGAGG